MTSGSLAPPPPLVPMGTDHVSLHPEFMRENANLHQLLEKGALGMGLNTFMRHHWCGQPIGEYVEIPVVKLAALELKDRIHVEKLDSLALTCGFVLDFVGMDTHMLVSRMSGRHRRVLFAADPRMPYEDFALMLAEVTDNEEAFFAKRRAMGRRG